VVVLVALGGHDDDVTARTAGIALIGTGLVVGALLAFYAVGLSEDRDREREHGRGRTGDAPSPPPGRAQPPDDPHGAPTDPRRIGPHRPPPRRRDHD
jgi:hypothetical protein